MLQGDCTDKQGELGLQGNDRKKCSSYWSLFISITSLLSLPVVYSIYQILWTTPEPLSIETEIIIILMLVIVNGIFAMTEMAMVSSRRTRLHDRADKGDTGAQKALDALKEPNRFLSSIQIGITLIGILAGVSSVGQPSQKAWEAG